jgi:hypothetical protein
MLNIQFIFLMIVFLGGLYFYLKYTNPAILENMENNVKPRCPNLLIQIGSKYYLYNSNLKKVPGVNPIEFSNLEDYTDFLKWQESVGVKCPVLYVQNTYDAQGNRVYKMRPDVCDLQGGLPSTITPKQNVHASKNITTINMTMPDILKTITTPKQSEINSLIDFSNQNIEYPGSLAPLTPKFDKLSDDPMNTNWGGEKYTDKMIDEGKYKANEVLFY